MVKTQNRTALAVLTSTLAVTCLMAIVVYHAEVPSALLQTSQLVVPPLHEPLSPINGRVPCRPKRDGTPLGGRA